MEAVVSDAFDGVLSKVTVVDDLFDATLHQPKMLRSLRMAELSDGTLRYLLWTATLFTTESP